MKNKYDLMKNKCDFMKIGIMCYANATHKRKGSMIHMNLCFFNATL